MHPKLEALLSKVKTLSPNAKRGLLAAGVMVPVCLWVGLRTSCVGATPPDVVPSVPVVAATATEIPTDAGVTEAGVPIAPMKTTATIMFTTVPPVQATVTWGKKRLGLIKPGYPLYVTRPRDSGPLDVVVKADGYFPVQTRAYTFNDSKMLVKLTKLEQANTLLGYRVPIEAGVLPGMDLADGGVPPAVPSVVAPAAVPPSAVTPTGVPGSWP